MKKIIFLVLITLFITGCEKEEENELNFPSIDLITNDSPTFFAKTVILFEDSEYLIKTNFDTYINSYPFDMYGYDKIKEQVIQDSNNQDVLFMTDYLYQALDSTYILAHHLENGTCLIFDKKRNEIIPKIKMEEYMEGEPMMSTGGRRFYIKENLFLETVDLIS
ncbi:hypothetical protein [Carboxylicivirga taeanensis]|uniref:hypothetical protein n=1 Tax=Carboxylicivirga taeanensis TaxID=1416875 RepID=UPI003F6DE221